MKCFPHVISHDSIISLVIFSKIISFSIWCINLNPGPRQRNSQYLSICHWNLNILPDHNFSKVSLFQAYNSLYKYDIKWLHERYLKWLVSFHQVSLSMKGYNLILVNNPLNVNRVGVCSYYRETLPVRSLALSYLSEYLTYKLKIYDRKVLISTLFCSASKTTNQFHSFLSNFSICLTKFFKMNLDLKIL